MSEDTERREFLKTAGAAALGGMAVAAVSSTEASAQSMPASRRLTVYAKPNVTVEELFVAFKAGLGRTSCNACGLIGIVGTFMLGDPPESIQSKGGTVTLGME